MNTVPADIFEEAPPATVNRPAPEEVRVLAETVDFHSRQPALVHRPRRGRRRTGRTEQFACRITPSSRRYHLPDIRAAGLDNRRDDRARPRSSGGKDARLTNPQLDVLRVDEAVAGGRVDVLLGVRMHVVPAVLGRPPEHAALGRAVRGYPTRDQRARWTTAGYPTNRRAIHSLTIAPWGLAMSPWGSARKGGISRGDWRDNYN